MKSTKAQRLRVAELLDGLACQEEAWTATPTSLCWGKQMTTSDLELALRATEAAGDPTVVYWRYRYAEAAQLLREGRVR